jgi:hypothetical protein
MHVRMQKVWRVLHQDGTVHVRVAKLIGMCMSAARARATLASALAMKLMAMLAT